MTTFSDDIVSTTPSLSPSESGRQFSVNKCLKVMRAVDRRSLTKIATVRTRHWTNVLHNEVHQGEVHSSHAGDVAHLFNITLFCSLSTTPLRDIRCLSARRRKWVSEICNAWGNPVPRTSCSSVGDADNSAERNPTRSSEQKGPDAFFCRSCVGK